MTDRKTILIVVATLGATIILAVVGAVVLAFGDRTVPDLVADLAKVSLGAVAALLARTSVEPDTDSDPTPPTETVILPPRNAPIP